MELVQFCGVGAVNMESESLTQCWDGVFLKAALLNTAVISSQRIIQKSDSDFMSGSLGATIPKCCQ